MFKVLIVDDSHDLLEFFTHLLSMKGYIVATASSKETLHNKLENFFPDIILLDVWLGRIDGRELCKEIKENSATKHIPAILLSANPILLKNYEECNAVDVIEKPFDIRSVIQKIERALSLSSSIK